MRDYFFVDDLIDGIYRASLYTGDFTVFNFGSGIGCSLNDLVDIIRTVVGRDLKVNYKTGRIFDVPKIILNISRAKTVLSWEPVTPLNIGIQKTWEYVKMLL